MTARKFASGGSLSNIRILDLTRVWAGPLATRIFGDFGAEVIKISDPRVSLLSGNGLNNKLNRNKKNIGLRLDIESGRKVFLELVSKSDVVIENFRPRVMRNLGLSFDQLTRSNPSIVMVSMPGFGTEGPYSEFPAFGTTAEALAGIPSLIGYEEGAPISTGIAYGDPISGLYAVSLILAALRKREKFGGGQFIDIALATSPVCMIGEYIGAYSSSGELTTTQGNRHPDYCPHGAYKCKGFDSWIAISVTDNQEWKSLCNILSSPQLSLLSSATVKVRKENEDLINQTISEWSSTGFASERAKALQRGGIPAGMVSNSRQLMNDEHLNARNFFHDTKERDHGIKRFDGQSISGNSLPKSTWKNTSDVGEDSRSILTEILGYSDSKCAGLESEQAVYIAGKNRVN